MQLIGNILHFNLATADEIARELGQRLRAYRLAENIQQSELGLRTDFKLDCGIAEY